MKFRLSVIVFLISVISRGQTLDDFSDGDFTANPVWSGNAADFTIVGNQLRSNSTTASSSFYLSTPSSTVTNCQWEFWCNFQFNTSSANYSDIYIVADQANLLSATLNGYFIRIGNTADEVCLYKSSAGTVTKIIDGADGTTNQSNSLMKIKVVRNASNQFTLSTDFSGTGNSYGVEGSVTDNGFLTSNFFGVVIKQSTASFFQKHFFDDFYCGAIIVDTTPPQLTSVSVTSSTSLDVRFSESIELSTSQTTTNYSVNNGIGSPLTATRDASDLSFVHLTFATPFPSAIVDTLSVSAVMDLAGNAIAPSTKTFSYYVPVYNDIVINEIMCDPDPPVALPNYEYVELYNRSAFDISLNNFSFSTSTVTKQIPNIVIYADSFIVLTGTSGYTAYSGMNLPVYEVIGFPALTNGGTELTLRNPDGKIINSVTYDLSWYDNDTKSEGGYSLEMIDPLNPCAGENNWKASSGSSGGTPGVTNSVYSSNSDNSAPSIKRITVLSSDSIEIFFNEKMDSVSMLTLSTYSINNSLGNPIAIVAIANNFSKVKLKLSAALQVGTVYTCAIGGGLKDCAGNVISATSSAQFAVPEAALHGDLVINEILFDPKSGGVDFVELYNRSSKTIDLSTLNIGSQDTIANVLTDSKLINSDGYLFFPGEYVILSEDASAVKAFYYTSNPAAFLDMATLPSMNTDDDIVVISDLSGVVIDKVVYTSSMHFDLLNDTKGVSLERIDFNRSSSDKTNWNSAASNVGFATPAYRNSQYLLAVENGDVSVEPETFSPDNDGYQDVVNISYSLETSGQIANVSVYDANGRLTRRLLKSETLSQKGTISWNGITDQNEKAPIGIYVIYFESLETDGKVHKFKRSCVLAGKF
jgi:hypothetical protein